MTKTALLFPGQGAQHVGMGAETADAVPAAKALYDQAADVLGYDLLEVCRNGPAEKLDSTAVSQPALYVCSMAALERLKDEHPDAAESATCAAGLSLGEYTALAFAGVMSFADGLAVVKARGEAMQAAAEATPSGMVSALMLDAEKVQEVRDEASAEGTIEIANYLCPGNTVLSGIELAVKRAEQLIEEKGGKPVPLSVAGAFHTEIMRPADQTLGQALATVALQPPRIPVYSNVDAATHEDPAELRDLLVRQVLSPVRWEDSVRAMMEAGVETFYEVGPGSVLKGLMKRINRKTPVESVS